MKHRFLVHDLNHTTLLVDITAVGLPEEIYPPEGTPQPVSSRRFKTWRDAEQHLLGMGANQEQLRSTFEQAKKNSVAVLTIV
jgi:hypothetical protein